MAEKLVRLFTLRGSVKNGTRARILEIRGTRDFRFLPALPADTRHILELKLGDGSSVIVCFTEAEVRLFSGSAASPRLPQDPWWDGVREVQGVAQELIPIPLVPQGLPWWDDIRQLPAEPT